jgi:hypothetical protein
MTKAPIRKMANRIVLFFFGRRTLNKRGRGMEMMIRSELILKTALVMR